MDDIFSRLANIHDAIAIAAQKAGRDPAEIELLAVSKTQPVEAIQEAIRAGITHFGENKVQEARGKIESLGRGVWHLIGHLQSNKAKDAVRLFDSIDSVDRADLAEEINHRAEAFGKVQDVLLQVNIAGESTKFGCAPETAGALAETINGLPRLCLRGLMTIAPYSPEAEKSRPHFAGLRLLRDKMQADTGLRLPVLSMGMSGDFLVAIEEGSTCVRIGTALFGERVKLKNRRPEIPRSRNRLDVAKVDMSMLATHVPLRCFDSSIRHHHVSINGRTQGPARGRSGLSGCRLVRIQRGR